MTHNEALKTLKMHRDQLNKELGELPSCTIAGRETIAAIDALEEQPAVEPVGHFCRNNDQWIHASTACEDAKKRLTPLYTHPAPAPLALTDDEAQVLHDAVYDAACHDDAADDVLTCINELLAMRGKA